MTGWSSTSSPMQTSRTRQFFFVLQNLRSFPKCPAHIKKKNYYQIWLQYAKSSMIEFKLNFIVWPSPLIFLIELNRFQANSRMHMTLDLGQFSIEGNFFIVFNAVNISCQVYRLGKRTRLDELSPMVELFQIPSKFWTQRVM